MALCPPYFRDFRKWGKMYSPGYVLMVNIWSLHLWSTTENMNQTHYQFYL